MSLAVQAQILRTYEAAVQKVFGPLVDRGDVTGEMLRLLLAMANETASCAESIAVYQAQTDELRAMLAVPSHQRVALTLVKGGKYDDCL